MIALERLACICFIVWLQVVGVVTHSVVHHILHAAPIVVLLFVRASPARFFTGLLAGYAWIFMLAGMTPMLRESLVDGRLFDAGLQPPYIWLAPVATLLAIVWFAANAALLARAARWLVAGSLIGIGLAWLLASTQPLLELALVIPLQATLEGEFAWAPVLLLEALGVLAIPAWAAFRPGSGLRLTTSFIAWQSLYWACFVFAMGAGLHPSLVRDR